jgi:hypothetical protein
MAQRRTLTERQIAVLRWIREGCPDGVMTDEGRPERITAGALRNRGLITTNGKGSTWTGSITADGKDYLERVDGPNPPVPREPNRPASERLMDELIAAGGTLRVPRRDWQPHEKGRPDYERRATLAVERGLVPPGKQLFVGYQSGELLLELRDAPEGTPTVALPVPVPDRVGRYHPVVVDFRDHPERHEVSRAQLPRVCRLLQGLVVEAERRGFVVNGPMVREAEPGWSRCSGSQEGHLRITVLDIPIILRVWEDGVVPRKPFPRYDYRLGSSSRRRVPAYDEGAKGTVRLAILAPRTQSRGQSSWADSRSTRLEDALPSALMAVEARAAEERERLQAERQEEQRRIRAWEQAKFQAREAFISHQRAEILDRQVAAWKRAAEIRGYCDAVDAAQPGNAEAAVWATWARAHAEQIDPLEMDLSLPDPPARISSEDLRPFLDGWSPYAPERDCRR